MMGTWPTKEKERSMVMNETRMISRGSCSKSIFISLGLCLVPGDSHKVLSKLSDGSHEKGKPEVVKW